MLDDPLLRCLLLHLLLSFTALLLRHLHFKILFAVGIVSLSTCMPLSNVASVLSNFWCIGFFEVLMMLNSMTISPLSPPARYGAACSENRLSYTFCWTGQVRICVWPSPQSFFQVLLWSVSHCLCSPIFFQSAMSGVSKSIFCPNAAPSEALSIVWWVVRIAHAASDREMLMSPG